MSRISKCAPLLVAIGWLALIIASLFVPDANYRIPFIASAAVNVVIFIAQFVVVNRSDR